jgi:hypothetical protein
MPNVIAVLTLKKKKAAAGKGAAIIVSYHQVGAAELATARTAPSLAGKT